MLNLPPSFFLKMGRWGIGVLIVHEHDVSVDVSICRSFHRPVRVVFPDYLLAHAHSDVLENTPFELRFFKFVGAL